MSVVFFLAITWSKPDVMFKFFKVQNLLQNAELGIYILLFEKQSRIDSSGINKKNIAGCWGV
jgi:hypothetical protein